MKLKIAAAAVTSLFIAGAVSATAFSSKATSDALHEMVAQSANGPFSIEFIERNNGFAQSSGMFRMMLNPDCLGPAAKDVKVPAVVRYTVNHLPGTAGFSSYAATVELEGKGGEFLTSASGKPVALELNGAYGFDARWSSRFTTPALAIVDDDKRLLIAASAGEVVESDGAGAVAWRLPSLSVDADGTNFEMTNLTMAARLHDVELGLGEQTLAIEKIQATGKHAQAFSVSGVRFDQTTSATNGFITTELVPSVGSLDAGGQKFEDLSLKMTVGGMDERALREINAVTANQCQSNLTDAQLKQIEESLLRLIDRGMTFSITDLKGRKAEDRFSAEIRFTMNERVDAASGQMRTLGERVSVSAQMHASAALVPPPIQQMAVQQGFAVMGEDGLRSSLAFGDGSLTINGVPDETGMADTASMFLAMGEDNLAVWQERIAEGKGPLVALAQATR